MVIDADRTGPPATGNGGWTSGLVAGTVDPGAGTVEVTLRQPPPVGVPLAVTAEGDGWAVRDPGGQLVATAAARTAEIEPVPPVSRTEALAASGRYPGHVRHPFPTCYVCGPQRADGLRIFPGPLPDGRTAATFTVPPEVTVPVLWAALDCPGGWTVLSAEQPYVLGRIAAVIDAMPAPDDECVVVGSLVRREGRKALVRTALYGPDGGLLARAEATWIAVA
ncbi:hypothetical protein [Catellatospora tritici]|uniref:hypothetical protein n=1 Tax=Catellatospora tritici TaxID=2851566 RepID=UPI001C2CCC56|nr:hypothetical protein [Catellatospora tritici]MBV1848941.1 hypothetical protein [Catellatospora tritici]